MIGNPEIRERSDREIIFECESPDLADCIPGLAIERWKVIPSGHQDAQIWTLQRGAPGLYRPADVFHMLEQIGDTFDYEQENPDIAFKALGSACAYAGEVAASLDMYVGPILDGAERQSKETGGTHPVASFGWLAKAARYKMDEQWQRNFLAVQLSTSLAHAMDSVLINWVEAEGMTSVSLRALYLIVAPEVLQRPAVPTVQVTP